MVNSLKSDTADSEPSFLIGKIPVIYAAAIAFDVKLPFLNHSLSKFKQAFCVCSSFFASRITASHSSMINTNFIWVTSVYAIMQSDKPVLFFNSGYSDISSECMESAILLTTFLILPSCLVTSDIKPAISRYITLYLLRCSAQHLVLLISLSSNKL